tara:strand:- start:703 stop:1590 length:888 start_codon:yes stop_codon:yes gene_type:complete
MFQKIKIILNNLLLKFRNFLLNVNSLEFDSKLTINNIKETIIKKGLPSYILDGYKVYSQNDEDGIINSIFKDIGITNKLFVEIGVGDGLENNTHNLILNDWNGIWIDSNKKQINKLQNLINENNKLIISSSKITKKNINNEIKESLYKLIDKTNIQKENIDFFSIDIDSLDIFCVSNLEIVQPRLICIEYNAKFPPPAKISIREDNSTEWEHDDYMGASIQFISDILETKGYKLISTNITGSNAFFVMDKYYDLCKTRNQTIEQLYMPPNYNLYNYYQGHAPSYKYLLDKTNFSK